VININENGGVLLEYNLIRIEDLIPTSTTKDEDLLVINQLVGNTNRYISKHINVEEFFSSLIDTSSIQLGLQEVTDVGNRSSNNIVLLDATSNPSIILRADTGVVESKEVLTQLYNLNSLPFLP
jgi:hypothetical protein